MSLTTELRNAHEHTVMVRRNRTSAGGPWAYEMTNCKYKGAESWDGEVCSDGHTLISRIKYIAN